MPPRRGEVWLFDLGMTAKTRPVLIVSVGVNWGQSSIWTTSDMDDIERLVTAAGGGVAVVAV